MIGWMVSVAFLWDTTTNRMLAVKGATCNAAARELSGQSAQTKSSILPGEGRLTFAQSSGSTCFAIHVADAK